MSNLVSGCLQMNTEQFGNAYIYAKTAKTHLHT